MLIISPTFRDYYDAVLKEGIDKTIIYYRYSKEIVKKQTLETVNLFDQIPFRGLWGVEVKPFLIGYAGKVRLVYNLSLSMFPAKQIFAFNNTDIRHFLIDHKCTKALDEFNDTGKSRRYRYGSRCYNNSFNLETTDKAFNLDFKYFSDIFIENKVPLFKIKIPNTCNWKMKNYDIELNPCLKEVQFYKAVDPFTMFQEIQMYISGVIGVDRMIPVTISDVSMRNKKGFDNLSFKTRSPGKKYNRRNK
jgi:hypothetical protein